MMMPFLWSGCVYLFDYTNTLSKTSSFVPYRYGIVVDGRNNQRQHHCNGAGVTV